MVYLDSSDFSILSNPVQRTPEVVEVEHQLISWRDTGHVELRFSYVHVIEAAPTKPDALVYAKDRLLSIQRLCGKYCLAAPFLIIENELRSLIAVRDTLGKHKILRENGDWIPELDLDTLEIPSPEQILKEEITALSQNRAARRKIERKFIEKDGRLKPAALAHLRKTAPAVQAQMQDRYPLSPEALADLGRYAMGQGPMNKVLQGLKDSFADLERFAVWYEKHWDKITPTSSWLRSSGRNLSESYQQTAAAIHDLYVRQEKLELPAALLDKVARDRFEGLLTELPRNITKRIAALLDVGQLPSDFENSWEKTPSLLTTITVMAHVGRLTALLPESTRSARPSDFGDILHTFYLPFVDVFRADAFIADAISQAAIPLTATVVPKFKDLPMTIEHRLSTAKSK